MNLAKPVLIAAACVVLCSGCSRGPHFDADRITANVQALNRDASAERMPGTAAETKTLEFLIEQLQTAGLHPGGDLQPDGTRAWTQDVPLLRTKITGPVTVSLRTERGDLSWAQGQQIALRAAQTGTGHVSVSGAPLVFVGYGVHAPERKRDDFKGIDLKGKVALFLVNDPDFEAAARDPAVGDFGGKAMSYYGRWTYKYEEAARRGAIGALVIHETDAASYDWATVKSRNTVDLFDVVRADPSAVHVPVEGWIQRNAAIDVLKRAGLNFQSLKARARTRAFRPVILPGTRIAIDFAVKRQPITSKNVVAVLPGRTHPDEWVLYSTHWDHHGVGAVSDGDDLYNGTLDNAAGVAQLLEIARNFARGKTQRSLGFLFVTAGEEGLLGSEYYAMNPLYPLARTVADINTDAPLPLAPAQDFSTAGAAHSTLQDLLLEVGGKFGRAFTPDDQPEAGNFFRADHFSFARRGVPAISYRSGSRKSEQQHAGFNDEWRADGIAADGLLLYTLGRQLADSRRWPEWNDGAAFKAGRDVSAAQRP